jgi:hypothetical protein
MVINFEANSHISGLARIQESEKVYENSISFKLKSYRHRNSSRRRPRIRPAWTRSLVSHFDT